MANHSIGHDMNLIATYAYNVLRKSTMIYSFVASYSVADPGGAEGAMAPPVL